MVSYFIPWCATVLCSGLLVVYDAQSRRAADDLEYMEYFQERSRSHAQLSAPEDYFCLSWWMLLSGETQNSLVSHTTAPLAKIALTV